MKVHISFEKPTSFVLKLDSVQQAAFEKWQKAHERSESFRWGDDSDDSWIALATSNDAWDEFIDSISHELSEASKAEVSDVTDVSEFTWGAVNP